MDTASSPAVESAAAPVLRRPVILAGLMLAMFMSAIEGTIVATAMPTIVSDLGGFSLFSWVFGVFFLASAVTTPVFGKLADMYGRKPVFYFGVGLFLLGSLLCGLARTMPELIAYRAIQGLGTGSVMPMTLTMVGDIYPGEQRAKVQGWIASVWAFASIVGPGMGAFIVQNLDWALVFWINLPVGAAAVTVLHLYFRELVERKEHRIDVLGALLLIVGTASLMLVLTQGAQLPATAQVPLYVVAVLSLGGFYWQERRAPEPMMPFSLWRIPIILNGNLAALLMGMLMMGVISFLPTYVQGAMGRSPAVAGFSLAMMSIGWPIASTLSGRVMVATSYRTTGLVGAVFAIIGCGVLTLLEPASGPVWAGAGSFLVGVGLGFGTTTYMVAIQTAVPWKQRGAATSGNMFMRILGMALGTAAFGAVVNYGIQARRPGETEAINLLMDPAHRATLGAERVEGLSQAMGAALQNVYVMAGLLALVLLVLAFRIQRGINPRTQPLQAD